MKNFIWKQFIVGLIVVVGLSLFVFLTIVISNNYGSFFRSSYTYKSIFKSSDGLFIGSEVTLHGTRTGNVVGVKILTNGLIEVAYTVRKNHAFMVNQSTKVGFKNKGMLGDRYINMTTSDLSASSIPDNSIIPVIETPDISSVMKSLGSMISQLEKKGRKGKSVNQLSSILSSLDNILKKIDKGQGSLGALINNKSLYNRLLILLGEKPRRSYLRDLSKRPSKK